MEHRTKEAQVADTLREGIIAGRYPRGSRLKQAEIAAALQTSSTPVREALKILEAEGYVQAASYRGCVVAPFDLRASQEVASLRVQLEVLLVRHAAARITADEVRELQELSRKYAHAVRLQDKTGARALNYRFHWRIYDIADQPQTSHFVQILWAKYPFDLQLQAKGRTQRSVVEHQQVLEALAAGDVAAALLGMRDHIELGWRDLRDSLNIEASAKG